MNELLTTCDEIVFNDEVLKHGGFLRAQAKGWDEARNGLVTFVAKDTIKALFFTGAGTAASYIKITAADVNNGLWSLSYSNDLEEIYCNGAIDTEETPAEP
ncbi:MAG: DUF5026 domain-containing protein [Clostridia bacterium]|nr:DUF5026 domain-containing protein [Clostridia bacterium]